jgi:hypothetical protein
MRALRSLFRKISFLHTAVLYVAVLGVGCGSNTRTHTLDLPPRASDAPSGSEIAEAIRNLDIEMREAFLFDEIARGNVPGWIRKLKPVNVRTSVNGEQHYVTIWVTPDYLSVGSDEDFFRIPLSPRTAQRVADLVDGSLPTPVMVNAIYTAADVKLDPRPIPPSPQMTTVHVFEEHNRILSAQLDSTGAPDGALIAGNKKDVVITSRLATVSGKVAIYGWHRLNGDPIQPLYTGHTECWVDYSHGIRLVDLSVLVDGTESDLLNMLRDERFAGLLSDEGVIAEPTYPRSARVHPCDSSDSQP